MEEKSKAVSIAEESPSKDGRQSVKFDNRKESRRHIELRKWDKDGDGELTIDELLEAAAAMRNTRKQRRYLLYALIGLFVFTVVIVFAMLGVTYWAVLLAKDYKVPASNSNVAYMTDKQGNPLSSNVPHVAVQSYETANADTTKEYRRLIASSPLHSLHRRRVGQRSNDDAVPAVTYDLLGTFPQSILLENLDVIKAMSQLTAVLTIGNTTKSSFHFGRVLSIDERPDHIYLETVGEDGVYFDIDCPLNVSGLCYVTWVTKPTEDFADSNFTKRKDLIINQAPSCCSDCSCDTRLSVSNCRQCGYEGYSCYLDSIGNPALATSYTQCSRWNGNCQDCTDCNGFYNNNGEMCKKRCPSQADQCKPACFPEDSLVELEDGSSLPIQLLRQGDKVAAMDANGEKIYSPFLTFMHSGKFSKPEHYKKITYTRDDNTTGSIVASGDHRIFVAPNQNMQGWKENPLPARLIQKGDAIFVMISQQIVPVVVDNVENTLQFGHYGPLTDAGTIIVSGVAASCYVESGPGHYYSDLFMTPFKWAIKSKLVIESFLFTAAPLPRTVERVPAEQFPLPGSLLEQFTQEVLIPAATYLK